MSWCRPTTAVDDETVAGTPAADRRRGDRAPMGCSVQGHDARRLIGFLERGGRKLAPFQKRFSVGAMAPGIRKAVLSGPRGLGKSSLTGELLAAAVDPAGPLFRLGGESVLLASSLDQARLCFGFLRRFVGEDGFRFQDSGQRVSCTHVPTRTRVRVASSDAKRAFGLGANTPIVVGDEPAAWLDSRLADVRRAGDVRRQGGHAADPHRHAGAGRRRQLVALAGGPRRRLGVDVPAGARRAG